MIPYKSGEFFGFRILTRLHGSAWIKAVTPAAISTLFMFGIIYVRYDFSLADKDGPGVVESPTTFVIIMSAFTFLLTFRANYSYNRYWEATGAVHSMQSKWMDVGLEVSSFHLQSSKYDKIKPPAFGEHPEFDSHIKHRIRIDEMTGEEMSVMLDDYIEKQPKKNIKNSIKKFFSVKKKKRTGTTSASQIDQNNDHRKSSINNSLAQKQIRVSIKRLHNDLGLYHGTKKTHLDSPFLHEVSHLLSLLGAVAMSTLRNDIECSVCPIMEYFPGCPWPPVDPDEYNSDIRMQYEQRSKTSTIFKYLFGLSRTEKQKTLYNAARPFRVLGGISDAEITMLQAARGPSAKVSLCAIWLQEFIIRESMNGSTGGVYPPILAMMFNRVSEGMLFYNQARKVAYIPFPFPHAQITSLFILVIMFLIPLLMICFTNSLTMAGVLNFFTVMCFLGLHEVALELENPFTNAPNDIPLNRFHAQFNESLVTMFFGYHPDSWWDISTKKELRVSDKLAIDTEAVNIFFAPLTSPLTSPIVSFGSFSSPDSSFEDTHGFEDTEPESLVTTPSSEN